MSSESSLSWHTPSTEPDEIIEIEKSLLCKDISIIQNATINSFNSNCLSDSSIYLKVTENNVNPGECEQNSYQHINCRTSLDIIQVYFQKLIPWKIPWILLMISVVQIVIYFMGCDDVFDRLLFSPSRKRDLWRFITYHFLHSGSTHLFLNIILQILIAVPLETEQGHIRTLTIYVGGVLFGAIGSAIINRTQAVVGSSAGVYSLLISHISHSILNYSSLSHRKFRIAGVIVLCLSDILFVTLYVLYIRTNADQRISLSAHGSGALGGFLCGLAIFKASKDSNKRLIYVRIIAILSIVCIIIVTAYLLYLHV